MLKVHGSLNENNSICRNVYYHLCQNVEQKWKLATDKYSSMNNSQIKPCNISFGKHSNLYFSRKENNRCKLFFITKLVFLSAL